MVTAEMVASVLLNSTVTPPDAALPNPLPEMVIVVTPGAA